MANGPVNQLNLFGPLRHIEQALAREISLLTKTDAKTFGPKLRQIREQIRDLDAMLGLIIDKRNKKNGRSKRL